MTVPQEDLLLVLRDLVAKRNGGPVVDDAPLETLGLDSLSVIELLMAVEDHFGVRIPVEGIGAGDLRDLRSLAAYAQHQMH